MAPAGLSPLLRLSILRFVWAPKTSSWNRCFGDNKPSVCRG